MTNRFSPLAISVYLGIIATAFGQPTSNSGLSFLVQEPGPLSSSGAFSIYLDNSNPLNSIANTTGPIGLGYVLAKPTGTGFYLIGPGLIESIDGAFATAPRIVSGLPGPPTAAALTPDGKLLLVGATDTSNNGSLFLVDTTTDQVIGSGIPLSGPATFQPGTTAPFCPECFITVSQDSKTAFVLTNTGIGARIVSINLNTRQIVNQLSSLFGGATSITLSPQGLLYVTAVNAIYEINPATLAITSGGNIGVFFTPFRLHFTPDGTTAYVVNLFPNSGGTMLKLTIANKTAITWPPFAAGVTPPTFDDIIVAGNNRIFAVASTLQQLVDVSPNPFSATASALTVSQGNNFLNVIAAAASNEIPNAKYLFFVVANGNQTNLYRINLATNTVDIQNPNVPNYPFAQVVTVPPQSGAANFTTVNANQILVKGGAAAVLSAQVTDSNGLPVFNAAAAFSTDPTNGAVITNASQVTNANGYVQANVSVPNVPGTYNITLTVNGASTVFVITVPGSTTGGPGTSQVVIVSGEGQLVFQNQSGAFPLTIQVNDTNGNPIKNVAVTFSMTTGAGFINTPQAQTDDSGQASTYFTGLLLATNQPVLPVVINASTQYGSVDFHLTVILFSQVDGTGFPQITLIQPSRESSQTINAPQGSPLPGAIEATLFATAFPATGQPLPNVAITTYYVDPVTGRLDSSIAPPARCGPGSTLSDSTGDAKCTLIVTCNAQSGPLGVAFGNPSFGTTVQLHVLPGNAQKFNFISGNNASGTAGQSVTLSAALVDGCGAIVPANTPVVWAVKSGSGTLTTLNGTTDSQGRAFNSLKLGQTPGPVTVTLTAGAISTTFTVTNSVIVSGITPFSGFPQTAKTSQVFASPVVFIVKDNNGVGIPGITVTFAVTGSATVNPGSATTDSAGKAQTTVTAGTTPGQITVTATALSFSATGTLTAQAPGPGVINTSFLNAASLQPGLVPCGLGIVQGTGIATNVNGVVSGVNSFGPLPFQLVGFSMTVQSLGGAAIAAPIEAVSNQNGVQQVNFQTPCEVIPGQATVVVTYNGSSTTVTNVQVLAAQPGTFTFSGPNGRQYGAIFDANGNYVLPTNPASFARRGQPYFVVVTGLGETTPPASTDSAGVPNQNTLLQSVIGINGKGVPVLFSQYAQGQIGAYVIGFQIPNTTDFPPGVDQVFSVAVIVNGQPVNNNQSLLIGGIQCPAGTTVGTAGCP